MSPRNGYQMVNVADTTETYKIMLCTNLYTIQMICTRNSFHETTDAYELVLD